ncbi:MAG: hypothetical protein HS116_27135 [Planctomycetes bacterium]|nr:hypothetical protein [Planctomycetota bacterium]
MTAASPPDSSAASAAQRLAAGQAEFERKFRLEPKLPSSALLTGAVAMATAFGAIMFLMFAWSRKFEDWMGGFYVFTALTLCFGAVNRYLAWRWFKQIEVWSAERQALLAEIEALRREAAVEGPQG